MKFAKLVFSGMFLGIIASLMLNSPAFAKDKNLNPKTDASGALAFAGYDNAPAHPVIGKNGMVSSQERIATLVGAEILAQGGNAVDAAVAVGFALAVTHPAAGNIGGGGFMLIAPKNGEVIAIDYREMAPAKANRDMYLDKNGNVDNKKAQFSRLSAGVPGSVAGLLHALDKYGTMSRQTVLKPAIKLADKGFPISYGLAQGLKAKQKYMAKDKSSLQYFYGHNGKTYNAGQILVQKDLAKTLKRISKHGLDGFYKGETAKLIVKEMQNGGGLISLQDLQNYKVKERKPVHGTYRGLDVYSMPPPSSGGVHLVQMLNILEGYELGKYEHNSADYLHLLIESMRRAYADRSKYLGDPDFYDVPVDKLIDKDYAKRLRKTIDPNKASNSKDILPGAVLKGESPSTTHYSVADKNGNAVSVTTTLNFSYGSGYSVDGAGFMLNNEMDDFSSKPGVPNGFGLIGGEANKIEPRKRPLSSMTPTIVSKDGQAYFVTGSPGGSTIITVVLQNILNIIDFDMNAMEANVAPRIHHQWLPDIIITEPGISADSIDILKERGFKFSKDKNGEYSRRVLGRANSIMIENGFYFGAADPRSPTSGAASPLIIVGD